MTTGSTQFLARPHSRLAWWAVWLMVAFAAMFLINVTAFAPYFDSATPFRQVFLPVYWVSMLSCGLAAGVIGLTAITRRRERSWLVWLALLTGIFALLLLFGVFFVPN